MMISSAIVYGKDRPRVLTRENVAYVSYQQLGKGWQKNRKYSQYPAIIDDTILIHEYDDCRYSCNIITYDSTRVPCNRMKSMAKSLCTTLSLSIV